MLDFKLYGMGYIHLRRVRFRLPFLHRAKLREYIEKQEGSPFLSQEGDSIVKDAVGEGAAECGFERRDAGAGVDRQVRGEDVLSGISQKSRRHISIQYEEEQCGEAPNSMGQSSGEEQDHYWCESSLKADQTSSLPRVSTCELELDVT